MSNEAIMAVAGAGKTESIVQRYAQGSKRTLFVTYTRTGQDELQSRLDGAALGVRHEVVGWYSFLIEYFLKPFMPDFLGRGSFYKGFNFEYRPENWQKGFRKQFDAEGRVGGQSIGYVARKISEDSKRAPIDRLEVIYEQIVFDEVQDLAASDLVVLEHLLESELDVFMVGDIRQTVFESSTSDRKYCKYRKANKLGWFTEQEAKGVLSLRFNSVNRRCHNDIVGLSNFVFDPSFNFPLSEGINSETGREVGLHHVTPDAVLDYYSSMEPLPLRWGAGSAKDWADEIDFSTFGRVKGVTVDRVLIFPTAPMKSFLKSGAPILKEETAAKFYVGLTRARLSVGFVLPKGFRIWTGFTNLDIKLWGG